MLYRKEVCAAGPFNGSLKCYMLDPETKDRLQNRTTLPGNIRETNDYCIEGLRQNKKHEKS